VNDILLITPPDKIHNQNISILLIYPRESTKNHVQDFLAKSDYNFNIYIYDEAREKHDFGWLLDVARFSDIVFLDVDNVDVETRDLASYLVSLSNVYWLTQAENSVYNKLSAKRIWDLNSIQDVIGGKIEER
jgi:hypothetical protein